ncbi:MAG TPA: TlpA disulfide reductase family protein [Thermoanaerobaculia bacterium]|jgi:thiol-disulfide isomerase/thioredoxin
MRVAVLLFALLPSVAHAKTVAELFAQARAAVERSNAIAFEFELRGAEGTIRGKGTVLPQKSSSPAQMLVTTDAVTAWSDGVEIDVFEMKPKVVRRAATHRGGRTLLSRHLHGVPDAFAYPARFEETLVYQPKLAGTKDVRGRSCELVTIDYPGGQWRWYFDATTHLLRRQERISGTGTTATTETLDYSNVRTLPKRVALKRPSSRGLEQTAFSVGRVQAGQPLGDWSVRTPAGEVISSATLKGRVTIVDFWASWCGPCRPAMQALQKLRDEREDITILGLRWSDRVDIAAYAKKNGIEYALADAGAAADVFSIDKYGLPAMFVIGGDGRVVDYTIGYEGAVTERWLERVLAQATATK